MTLSTPAGIVELLHHIAAIDGQVNDVELDRIAEIVEALSGIEEGVALTPVAVLSLLFDVAISDGQIHESEASFLTEIAAASDSLEISLSSFREAWDKSPSYQERVRRFGLTARGDVLNSTDGSYAIGHAIVDICSALRRQGTKEIQVHLAGRERAVLVSASVPTLQDSNFSLLSLLGLQDKSPTSRGVLTRSTAALELHIAAAGGLVASSTSTLALHDGEAVVATAFGQTAHLQMARVSSLEWAQDMLAKTRHDVGVLLCGVGADSHDWKRRAFDQIIHRVDERLHRWGAPDCPGGPCNLRVVNFVVSKEGASDPFRKDALPRRVLKRFVEPRSGLTLDVRVHELEPVAIALAYRISANADMVEEMGCSAEGLLQALPAPGIYLYDDIGRCILIEHVPHDIERFVGTRRASKAREWIGRHRIRIDVIDRPQDMQSIDCLNFSALWLALIR